MHDANSFFLKVGDTVMIPAKVMELQTAPDGSEIVAVSAVIGTVDAVIIGARPSALFRANAGDEVVHRNVLPHQAVEAANHEHSLPVSDAPAPASVPEPAAITTVPAETPPVNELTDTSGSSPVDEPTAAPAPATEEKPLDVADATADEPKPEPVSDAPEPEPAPAVDETAKPEQDSAA